MNRNSLILTIAVLLLSACAEQPKKTSEMVPVEERNAPVTTGNQEIKQTEAVSDIAVHETKKQTEPVIVALISEADSLAKKGDTNRAAASIERALRIEPKNALLWHHLAKIRLQQQQWQQAIAMARKSNALAAYDHTLKSANWGVIATAYERLGNKEKAKDARKKQTTQG